MKRIRAALLASAGLVALGFAAPAPGAYEPKLTVATTETDVSISAELSDQDDPTFKVTFYAPPGWTANLAQAAGTQIGTASGEFNALDLGSIPITGTGVVRTANPAEHAASACAPGLHQAVWLIALTASNGTALRVIPVYVDTTTGAEADFSSLKMQLCLPPRDVPIGTPGRATFGVKLVRATLTLTGVFTPGDGNRWTALFTPWSGATPAVASTAEAQAIVGANGRFRITARRLPRNRARIAGRLTAGEEAVAGARVTLLANGRRTASATTNDNGSFSKVVRLRRTTTFRARAAASAREQSGGCNPILPLSTGGNARCTVVTFGAVSATSNSTKLTVRKAKPKRKSRGRPSRRPGR